MTTTTTTKKNRKVSLVGFAALSGDAIHVRVPESTYVLPATAWGALHIRGQAWGTEISRAGLEDEIGGYSVRWSADRGIISINDQADERNYCIREDDLMNIQPGQMVPVYGRDNPAWKYRQPVFQIIEAALPGAV